jgi:NADH-quinone oxidoreductase subunit H
MITWITGIFFLFVKLGLVLSILLLLVTYLVYVERKFLGRLQVRIGPNRAGPFGLLQPVADFVKMVTKEDIVPEGADRIIFLLAPSIVAATALLIFAVVPFGADLTIGGRQIHLVITPQRGIALCVCALVPGCVWRGIGWLGVQF